MPDGVLLIPGFFGFGTFGAHRTPAISYFDHVIAALEAVRPELRGRIETTEPPPTGSLVSRVRHLHARVTNVLVAGIGPQHRPVDRVHLVGHSTGGLDARLLANPRWWEGSPEAVSHRQLRERIGSIVTLSSPLYGTPIALRLQGAFALSLTGMYLLSIVAKAREQTPVAWGLVQYGEMLEILQIGTVPNAAALNLLVTLDPGTAGEIARFLDAVRRDQSLLNDLRPETVRRINATVDGGDTVPLRHVVSVAPEPRLQVLGGIGGNLFRFLYATTYFATADAAFEPRDFPSGPWIAGSDAALGQGAPRANDGVVPATSQTLAGRADAIVAADHLDVVGHFDSQRFSGTTIFRSDAGFDDVRFLELWTTIAGWLR